jgi:hypothetical protein
MMFPAPPYPLWSPSFRRTFVSAAPPYLSFRLGIRQANEEENEVQPIVFLLKNDMGFIEKRYAAVMISRKEEILSD